MTSTTTAQPLNFGPEWLRALSTPDSATSVPPSSGSGNGQIFKFSATRYRYSKDEILALRTNVSKSLSEDVRDEIVKNLKEVDNVFRPNKIDPLSLTAPTADENAEMNSLSSYPSGRTPGGPGRASNSAQQPQSDTGNSRGGSSMSNGRGGSRGRGGRDTTYRTNRNHASTSEDNSENGHGADETFGSSSSSRSRGTYHPRGGALQNRVRSFDDRKEPSEHSSVSANSSASWASRSGPIKRGGGSIEQRVKSNDKWTSNDDRSGSFHSSKASQPRDSGWRPNASMSDRDLTMRRSQMKRDRTPEWMDDNIEDDSHLGAATFEQDGTFTRSLSTQPNDSEKQQKRPSKSPPNESLSHTNARLLQQKDEVKSEKSTPPSADTAAVNISNVPKNIVSQLLHPVQKFIPSLDDDFDHHDLATTVVESTLAEDHDYSPSTSTHLITRPISIKPTPPAVSIISQQHTLQTPVIIDDKQWFYKDPQNTVQGPFSSADMERWFAAGYFTIQLPVKRLGETQFSTIQKLTEELGRLPFRTDVQSQPVQQPTVSGSHKNNSMPYSTSSTSNNAYIDEYLIQQHQSRQNVQNLLSYNRQTSMPLPSNDRKAVSSPSHSSSQSPMYFHSQQSSSSPLTSNLINDQPITYKQQRNISSANQLQSNSITYDDIQRSSRHLSSQSNPNNQASFFSSNTSAPQQTADIISRLSQARQVHGQQHQDIVEESHRRGEQQQQPRDEFERSRLLFEQERLKRQQDELRQRHEQHNSRQMMGNQFAKPTDYKKQSAAEIDPFLALQQSVQYQKERQAQIDAQKAENVRRYQQHYRETAPQPPLFRIPEAAHWTRHPSSPNDQSHSSQFFEMQKQEQEQERRLREAATAVLAHQHPKNRSTTWNSTNQSSNLSLQDMQRQQPIQNDVRQHFPSAAVPTWDDHFSSQQPSSSFWDNQHSSSATRPTPTGSNKPSTPWAQLKSVSSTANKPYSHSNVSQNSEDELNCASMSTRTQNDLTKWTETQSTDVSTLVQLLKDMDHADDMVAYVQPYVGSVSKAKDFVQQFFAKSHQSQLTNASMSLNSNTNTGNDIGF